MIKQFYFKQFQFVCHLFIHRLNVKQLIWHIDRTLSDAIPLVQSASNEEILRIPQCSSINRASSSDCLMSGPGHSLGVSYLSVEMQLVYFIATANRALQYLICASLLYFYHITKEFSAMEDTFCFLVVRRIVVIRKYSGSWCTNMFCTTSLFVWFKSSSL